MAKQVTNAQLAAKIDVLADTLTLKVEKIEKILTGNGEPERGLIIRVDRLEQLRKWVFVIAGTLATYGVSWAYTYLPKG